MTHEPIQHEPTEAEADRRRAQAVVAQWLPVVVFVLTAAAFLPSLSGGFVNWDDSINFVQNPHYRGLGWEQIRWAFTTFHAGPYQPLSWLTLGLDYTLWGMDPTGYHLTSLLLHAATAAALYFLALRLFALVARLDVRDAPVALRLAAACAALLFGVHPLRVESVAWATERRDVVSGLFWVLTVVAYLRAAEAPAASGERRTWLGWSLAAYVASLLGKGIGVTLPVVLIILDVYPLRRLGPSAGGWTGSAARRVWLEKTPYIALALAAGLIGVFGQLSVGAVAGLDAYGPERRIGVALFATAFYLYKTVLPVGLSPLVPMPRELWLFDAPYLLSAGVIVSVTLGAWWLRRRVPALAAVWATYLVMLAPVSGLTQMGPQIAADRYTYLPCLGWALLAGWLVWWLARGRGETTRGAVYGLACLVVLALGGLTWRQSTVWHDSQSLWSHAASVYPDSHIIQRNWGAALDDKGDPTEALARYQEAARLAPESPEAHNNIGLTLTRLGLPAKGEAALRKALDLNPEHAPAHFNLANALVMLGRAREALGHYELALKYRPNLVDAHVNRANTLAKLDRTEEAEAAYRQAIHQQPSTAGAYGNLATLLLKQRRYADAVELLRQGVAGCPDEPRLKMQLALLLAAAPEDSLRDGEQAVRLAELAVRRLGRRDPTVLNALAAAYAEAGRFDEAVATMQRAIEAAGLARRRGLVRQYQGILRQYQAEGPFRLPTSRPGGRRPPSGSLE